MGFIDELIGTVAAVPGQVVGGVVTGVVDPLLGGAQGFLGEIGLAGPTGGGGPLGSAGMLIPVAGQAIRAIGGTGAGTTALNFLRSALGLAPSLAAGAAGAVAAQGISAVLTPGQVTVSPGGVQPELRTQVIAVFPDGTVELRSERRGTPFLMRQDLIIAKRVFRTLNKAHSKLPRRMQKQGLTAQLTEAVLDETKRRVVAGSDGCPTKC